jgi:hypothetical protein
MTPDAAPSANLADPGSWNRYAYVGGDPVNRIDPNGQYWVDISFGGSYQVGAPSVGWWGCDYYCQAGIAAVTYWLDLYNQYSTEASQLQDLQSQGQIDAYSVNYATGNTTLSFSSAGTLDVAIPICIAQPELCVATGGVVTIVLLAPYVKDLISLIIERSRANRDPPQVKNLPGRIAGTSDSNGDCIPPDPSQKGPPGMTFKWQQQRSSAPAADPNAAPHWHWTQWNFNVLDCEWFYNGRGEGSDDPGPGYALIPGVF